MSQALDSGVCCSYLGLGYLDGSRNPTGKELSPLRHGASVGLGPKGRRPYDQFRKAASHRGRSALLSSLFSDNPAGGAEAGPPGAHAQATRPRKGAGCASRTVAKRLVSERWARPWLAGRPAGRLAGAGAGRVRCSRKGLGPRSSSGPADR